MTNATAAEESIRRSREKKEQAKHANGAAGAQQQGPDPYPYVLAGDLQPNLINNDIVKDLLPRRAFGAVNAVSSGGKTAITVDLLLHIADGREYRGRRVQRQPVVFVALEGHAGIANRVIAARDHLGIIGPVPFALIRTSDTFRDPMAAQRVALTAHKLQQRFGGDNPVVGLDTYTAALGPGSSDCDPKDVSALIQNIQTYLLGNCTVAMNHHFGKDLARGGRGWSGLQAALDFEWEIDRNEDDLRTMRVTKARDGSDSQPAFCYRFLSRTLGTNNHGETVSAVVVDHLADEDETKRGKRFTKTASKALTALWDCIKDPSRSWPMDDGLRCTLMPEWEKACLVPGVVSDCKNQRDRRSKFTAAHKELEAAGALIRDGASKERVYPAPKVKSDDCDEARR